MPDRIEKAAGDVQGAAHELVSVVKRVTRKWWFVVAGLVVAYLILLAVVVDNRQNASGEKRQADREAEVRCHTTNEARQALRQADKKRGDNLIEVFAEFVPADSEQGQAFLMRLREDNARIVADLAESIPLVDCK